MTNEISKQANPFEITSFEQAERYAKMIAESDFAPKDYKGKPGNVMIAMQMGHELGLKPNQAIQNIAVVNGRPMIWGDAALALVIGNPECNGVREWIDGTIKDGTAVAYCEVTRGKEIILREFSVAQAAKAQLLGKNVWAAYPERMLQMRARGFALRDSFPDVLKGIYVEGEMVGVTVVDGTVMEEVDEKSHLGMDSVKDVIQKNQHKLSSPTEVIEVETINVDTGEIIEPSNAPSFDEVKTQMESATTVEQLILASDVARSIGKTKEQHDELAKIYKRKQHEVKA
jgi:hypothetical protein